METSLSLYEDVGYGNSPFCVVLEQSSINHLILCVCV